MVICYYNGKFAPMPECTLPMTDLAIQRGVGTFETIRIYDGVPFAMEQHLERLAGSTEGAGIKAGAIIAKLPEIIREGLARPEIKGYDGVVKPYITGGDVNDKGTFPTPRFFVVFDEKHPQADERREEERHSARTEPRRAPLSAHQEHKLPFRLHSALQGVTDEL